MFFYLLVEQQPLLNRSLFSCRKLIENFKASVGFGVNYSRLSKVSCAYMLLENEIFCAIICYWLSLSFFFMRRVSLSVAFSNSQHKNLASNLICRREMTKIISIFKKQCLYVDLGFGLYHL